MKYVDLPTLATQRFAALDRKRTMRWLRTLARRDELPGARRFGGRWMVDIQQFDAPPANDPAPAAETLADMVARARAARSAT